MYRAAQYINGFDGKPVTINLVTEDNRLMSVLIEETSDDYKRIMQLVAEGKLTIAPAEGG